MASLDYIAVPACATRLQSRNHAEIKRAPTIRTSLPHPKAEPPALPSSPTAASPLKRSSTFDLLPTILLSATLPNAATINASNAAGIRKKTKNDPPPLLSQKDPLSVQITSSNFKRFVERVGPVFWLQDRVEEIVMWRRGWKLTTTWIAVYALLCYFPRLLLLIPQFILISIILATHQYPTSQHTLSSASQPLSPSTSAAPAEGSVDWQGNMRNIQAIQNLMGFYADAYTLVSPIVPHLSSKSPYTAHILCVLVLSLPPSILLVHLATFPLRTVCLFLGIVPLALTHPYILPVLISLKQALPALGADINAKLWRAKLERWIDDNSLTDECWSAEMKEVELFENERTDPADPAEEHHWSKAHLKPGERSAWTRGRDGWTGVGAGGDVSNLTFSLAPGWAFVQTEDWRTDYQASWAEEESGGDANGWVYTNDAWLDPKPYPDQGTVTRRRRWVRRVWFSGEGV